jgi:uncharacterized protein YkwD
LLALLPQVAGARPGNLDAGLGRAVLAELNAHRAANDLSSLRPSAELREAARDHVLDMARLGYFSHESLDGRPPDRRIAGYYPPNGSIAWGVGEILLWASWNVTASEAVERWLGSGQHRREIFGRWQDAGVAAVRVDSAPGVFGGRSVTLIAVDFGRRP